MWDELILKRMSLNNNFWCAVGDLNAVRRSTERREVSLIGRGNKEMDKFNWFLQNMGLYDIPMISRRFTWYNASVSAMSRLDSVLLSV